MDAKASIAEAPVAHLISVDLYSFRGNKNERLINNSGPEAFDAKSQWFSYSFSTAVYLTELVILVEGYGDYDKFEVVVDHIDGTRHEQRVPVTGDTVSLRLGKLSSGFKFKPEKRFFGDPRLVSVSAIGLSLDEFHSFEWHIKEHEKRIKEVTERERKYESLSAEVSDRQTEKASLEAEIGKSRAELAEVRKNIREMLDQAEDAQGRYAFVANRLENAKAELDGLTESIQRKTSEYNAAVKELRLFPTEISGFIREGNRSIKFYLGIGLPFAIILALVTHKLFSSAVDLTQLWRREQSIDIWTVFLTRLPFVLVAIAIIEVCAVILGRLVFEVIRINRQRTEFAKLSIIARDVSTASSQLTPEMSENEVFDKETALKMELLREHMKNYVGGEFEYKGSGLIAAINGVAERFAQKKADG